MKINWFKNIGPGPLVAAAFIGPGTVTLCVLAGVQYGFALLWAMVLSITATIVLQEMTARLGLITQKGLAEIIRTEIQHPVLKGIAILLVLSAILIGNAAYEAGNITGSVLGMEAVFQSYTFSVGTLSVNVFSLLIGAVAFLLLYFGNYKTLERVFIGLVTVMSISFIITAVMTKPDLSALLNGVFKPSVTTDNILTVVGLIGTTVVPYNLFLHAALVKEKWQNKNQLKYAVRDTVIAVVLGGLVSMCIIVSAAAVQHSEVNSAADLAKSLEPLFGAYAKYFIAIGLFAAGITSTITAALAAAYVTTGCLGWPVDLKTKKFRAVWMAIVLLGVLFSSLGINPIELIKFAQAANGILLPVIAVFLLWIMNRKGLLGKFTNTNFQNLLGFLILAITVFLGLKSIFTVFNMV